MKESPWLREMVEEEEFHVLFSADEGTLQQGMRDLLPRLQQDTFLQESLVDLLETALDLRNDDTDATIWATVLLGESQAQGATSTLCRALAFVEDEQLQDAAAVSLVRLGVDALEQLMEVLRESESVDFRRLAYTALGWSGVLEDTGFTERVGAFLAEQVEVERYLPLEESAVEGLFQAIAELGRVDQLETLKEVLELGLLGTNFAMTDAIARLEENADGTPFVGTRPPWEDRYGWLFEDDPDGRPTGEPRGRPGETPGAGYDRGLNILGNHEDDDE